MLPGVAPAAADPPTGNPAEYTTSEHFDEGTLVNVNHDVADQLQLDSEGTPFDFIWVAASGRGTIIKIDTDTGEILGEYLSAPDGRGRNPSRTTVDNNGNVWAGNRDEYITQGSIVHVGLEENGQCVDRSGDGIIQTSSGLGDILPWPNTGGADDNGGVTTADDECIIHYVRTAGTAVRSVSVDANNNVWVGGYNNKAHEAFDSDGVGIPGTSFNLGCGGYGALMDGNGILWSASLNPYLLRYDPIAKTGACIYLGQPTRYSYGLGIDSAGNIWNSNWTANTITKLSPTGAITGVFNTGDASGDRGVAVTPDDAVWIANSLGATVSRLDNAGALQSIIPVGSNPTGLAVDSNGKVWVTNLSSHNVMRIDPATNLVDETVSLGAGASPYNYSDMTGSTLIAPPNFGTWSVVHDSGVPSAPWSSVAWDSSEPGDGAITVTVASSADGVTFGPEVVVTNGADPAVADAQYLKVIVSFTRSTTTDADGDGIGDSPVLFDLTLTHNRAPVADAGEEYEGNEGSPIALDASGSSDPDGDVITYMWSIDTPLCSFDDPTLVMPTLTCTDNGVFTATVVVDDGIATASASALVTVSNVAPTVTIDDYPMEPVMAGDLVEVDFSFTDPGSNDTHTAVCEWDDGYTVEFDDLGAVVGSDTCTKYPAAGIYVVTVTVTDDDGGVGMDMTGMIVVYDPSAGFVTGGGWIASPAGAYVPDPTLEGKATFGFVSKYKKGATEPTGNTEFQFHAASLNFHSSSYDWLVVTGGDYARYKGEGTINGMGEYKFMLWAGDFEPDTFRMRIWEEDEFGFETVIYDNGSGQEIAAGNIIVHTKKK
jgi:streptogramin lyase